MRTLVIGAYGHFGRLICQKLMDITGVNVIFGGRKRDKLTGLCKELGVVVDYDTEELPILVVDYRSSELARLLKENDIHVVIHAAGPFHGQDYSVARACIEAGCYYLDISDDRDFVMGIHELHSDAERANVMVASGMGLPVLNMAILDKVGPKFSSIEHISLGYSGSGRMPGLASITSALRIAGKPVKQIEGRRPMDYYGLLGRNFRFFENGFIKRDVLTLDQPDIDLIKAWYNPLTLRYQGGFGLRGQRSMSIIAKFARYNWIKKPQKWAPYLRNMGRMLEFCSGGKGALYMDIEGKKDRKDVSMVFEIQATHHSFEFLKIVPVIALIRRLMNDFVPQPGARPGIDLMGFEEIEKELDPAFFQVIERFEEMK